MPKHLVEVAEVEVEGAADDGRADGEGACELEAEEHARHLVRRRVRGSLRVRVRVRGRGRGRGRAGIRGRGSGRGRARARARVGTAIAKMTETEVEKPLTRLSQYLV
jgi:hypothetical protein